jgi:chromosome segregation ATPase
MSVSDAEHQTRPENQYFVHTGIEPFDSWYQWYQNTKKKASIESLELQQERRIIALETQIAELTTSNANQTAQIAELTTSNANQTAQIAEMETLIDQQKTQISGLQTAVSNKEMQKRKVCKQLTALEETKQSLEQHYQEIFADFNIRFAMQANEINTLKTRIQNILKAKQL